ncbi:MAG TPA: mechanosensitive ion channel family protein [Candidatus Methylomirabilis sp.]|nr:mechanosensitive ion channel family protein [Candidatus Methylomirabilis sp.]
MSVTDMILDLVIRYGFQVLGALVILGVGILVARWIGRLAEHWLQGQKIEPPVRLLVVRSIRVVVLLFALVVALDKFGFQIAPLVAGIGAVGLGITFALQGVLGNMMAGLTIIFTKPFRVGEYIALLGVHGAVVSIELFSTTLTHPDRSRVVIPNRKIVGEILHNYGAMRQLHLMVSVPHTADLARVLALTREVVTRSSRVLSDPAPVVGVEQVGDSGIRIGLHPWVQVVDVVPAEAEIYRALVEEFRKQGIGVGLPQREVFLLSGAPPAIAA